LEKPSVVLKKIILSGGQVIEFGANEKIIIVGPNNSGKSRFLKDIEYIISRGNAAGCAVVSELELEKNGTVDNLKEFILENAEFIPARSGKGVYNHRNWSLPESHIDYWRSPYLQYQLHNGFIKNITTEKRLSICDQQNSVGPSMQKQNPQNVMYDSELLMNRVSDLFYEGFSENLMIDFRGGNKVPIHVGKKPSVERKDRVSDEYVKAVRAMPLLDQQGDGMRSYAGIVFEAIVDDYDITLIDEPEAFLHPPQMRKIGSILAKEVLGQLFFSTHSSDILRGFLDGSEGKNIRILRITRDENLNSIVEAENDIIKTLWEKPILKYSNALEGIFHTQAIICEDDSDCRLINAAADFLISKNIV